MAGSRLPIPQRRRGGSDAVALLGSSRSNAERPYAERHDHWKSAYVPASFTYDPQLDKVLVKSLCHVPPGMLALQHDPLRHFLADGTDFEGLYERAMKAFLLGLSPVMPDLSRDNMGPRRGVPFRRSGGQYGTPRV